MKDKWESPTCPICKSKKYLRSYYKDITTWEFKGRFSIVKCNNCGLLIQSPRAPFNQVSQYYPSERYWGMDANKLKKTKNWKKKREKDFGYIYKRLLNYRLKGKILDIGCGTGAFLTKFKEKGWETCGTDIIKPLISYARKVHSLTVLEGNIEDIPLKENYFDVITINNVLEHVYHPDKTLIKVRKLLKKDGIIMIAVPNSESIGHHLFRKNWNLFSPGRHLYIFSPNNITTILERSGLDVISIYHNYFVHNFNGLFNSARMMFSPKFKKSREGGLEDGNIEKALVPSKFNLIKEIGKIVFYIFAYLTSLIEPIIERSEIMTIYAKRKD